jgi:hypothetical protein
VAHMKLNGWQRLWIAVCVWYLPIWAGLMFLAGATFDARPSQWASALGVFWLAPCLALYIVGWMVAWIRRGF